MAEFEVTVSNRMGSTSCKLSFECVNPISPEWAIVQQLETCTDIEDLPEEPAKSKNLIAWMIWMVHRVWLNDPSLKELDFSFLSMPLPHEESRVAPKLMEALANNTHLEKLVLPGANMRVETGKELATALQTNTCLRFMNLESNHLDPQSLMDIADALRINPGVPLETWKFANQSGRGDNFGNQVEEKIAEMLEVNDTVTKVGFAPHDAHWKNRISNLLTRNADLARRRRKSMKPGGSVAEDTVPAKTVTLVKVNLNAVPSQAVWEVFSSEDEQMMMVCQYVSAHRQVPKSSVLQSFASSQKVSVPFSKVAKLLNDFVSKLLDANIGLVIECRDSVHKTYTGSLSAWSSKNSRYSLDVLVDSLHYNCKSDKEPEISVSPEVAAWIAPPQ